MQDFFSDVVEIGGLVIIAIFAYLLIYGWVMKAKRRNGTLKPKQLIAFTSAEMMIELSQCGFKEYGLGRLDSVMSLDGYIEMLKERGDIEELLRDKELILQLGSFLGELLRAKKHFHWKFSEDLIPSLVKKEEVIYPYELIKQKIRGELESLYDYALKV